MHTYLVTATTLTGTLEYRSLIADLEFALDVAFSLRTQGYRIELVEVGGE